MFRMEFLLIVGVTVCHELGHVLCARSLGLKIRRVGINWRGPYIVREQGNPLQNLAVSLAGPLMNLILAGTMILAPWLGTQAVVFGLYNMVLGLYNILPVPCSDGRRIMKLLFSGG
jgi:stage IV sporulation protein FB